MLNNLRSWGKGEFNSRTQSVLKETAETRGTNRVNTTTAQAFCLSTLWTMNTPAEWGPLARLGEQKLR